MNALFSFNSSFYKENKFFNSFRNKLLNKTKMICDYELN